LLAVGVLLTVAGIVVAVQYGRLGGPAPPALPSDAPPQGIDLVYALNPGHPHGLVAYDWSGKRQGAITFPTWVNIARLRPAPNGSGFMLDPPSQDDYAAYFDRYAHTVFETNDPSFVSQAWADDSTHVCVYTSEGDLLTRDPGQPERVAHTRVADQFSVAACSLGADEVVLASSDRVDVVRLSTGATLREAGLASSRSVVASLDAAFFIAAGPGGADEIFKTSDLSTPVGHLDVSLNALAFSGDDSLVLVTDQQDGGLEAIVWRTGRLAWRYDTTTKGDVGFALGRPSGRDFIAYFTSAPPVVIHADGKVTALG
jgi:hypothetical protein